MKKIYKRISIFFILIIFLLTLVTVASLINHKTQLSKEDKFFIPNGKMVEVNGHRMHIYIEGSGEETLVFMSGGGTSSPVLDFKSLYSLLSDNYKIVVVEKAGYGFSEINNSPRDIDSILSETRQAISKSGIEGPYILVPHSMSGIEALYWAQLYPDEIKAIIGLDMAVSGAYENFEINKLVIELGAFIANTGLIRWIPDISESDAIKYGALTEEEKKLYKVIFYRRTATINMRNEVAEIKKSAKKVEANSLSNTPILLFSSNGKGTGWDEKVWKEHHKDFINNAKNRKLIELNCSHYVHDIEHVRIAKDID